MNSIAKYFGLIWLTGVLLAPPLFGQAAGNDNPGGVMAEYHGSSNVAGQYDPYTGNAKRDIDDTVVAGTVGAYPLKFTRTLNTRGTSYRIGGGGGWRHNYDWGLWVRPPDMDPGNGDGFYDGPVRGLTYPSGGYYETITYDSPWPIEASGRNGPVDLLVDCAAAGSSCVPGVSYELRRADGGKVFFQPGPTANSYLAFAIDDPYGQRTTLSYSGDILVRVTEPGGRYLELFYETDGSATVLSMVRANDGRGNAIETVTYQYDWVWQGDNFAEYVPYLTHVNYDDGAQANYTYATANSYDTPGVNHGHLRQVVHSCDDPRYAGPMKYIEYDYVAWTEVPDVGHGQIKAEKNVLGQVVSRTTYPTSPTDPNLSVRTETRGDGPSRTFTYGGFTWTDFKNHAFTEEGSSILGFDGWRIIDPLGHATTYECEPVVGALKRITHPGDGTTREYTFTDAYNPYYHSAEKDENGNWTYFDRDPNNHQITQIRYPDQSTEEFTYNGFGQVLTHKLRSGGTETFTYDARGLKQTSYPPATESDPNPWNHPTRYYYYQSGPNTDRLSEVEDPRENWTEYEYNPRGQVTHLQHQDYTYTQSSYNLDGTLAWTADENDPGAATDESQRTRYTYDEYKRVLTVTNPMGETTENCYALDPAWADPTSRQPLLHTTNSIKYTKSPMQKNVVYEYDNNLRKTYQGVALGSADAVESRFDYDEVGNLNWTRDPRWNVTTFGYDARNRKIWIDDPITSDRNSTHGHTMDWEYDGVGNKLKETRADDAFRSWEYDVPNRTTLAIDWRMSTVEPAVITKRVRDLPSGASYLTVTEHVYDAKNAEYKFEIDALGRKTKETYPPAYGNSSPNERFWYDEAGNLKQYQNPAGQTKYLNYDNRNRVWDTWWDGGVGPLISTRYDAASRVTSLTKVI